MRQKPPLEWILAGREHVLLALLAEKRLLAGVSADLGALLEDVLDPPIERVGALETEAFISKRARKDLAAGLKDRAAGLNTLLT